MKPTGTEARICELIAQSQQMGIAKYGTTVENNPLGLVQWLKHLRDEMLDGAVYAQRAIEQLEGVEGKDADVNSLQRNDPHAELRKTWKPGQRWQGKPALYEPCFGWNNYDPATEPEWLPDWSYRRHPDDKDPAPEAEKPWLPDNSGEWVEVPDECMKCPVDKSVMVAALLRDERLEEDYSGFFEPAEKWQWDATPNALHRIVAYKVAK